MSEPIDEVLTEPTEVDEIGEPESPRSALRGRGRDYTRPWRSGFCSCGNHIYCPGDVTNGSLAGGQTILCACDCHQPPA